MDTNFVNGLMAVVMEQFVESVTTEVIKRLPYYTECEAKLKAIEERLETLEKHQVQTLVSKETVEGMITDQLSDYVLTDDLKDAINEELPDFEDLVNEHLPDMDDFVKREDIEDMVGDSISNSDIVETEDLDKVKASVSKTEQQVNNLRVLMHTLKTEIEQYLSPALK